MSTWTKIANGDYLHSGCNYILIKKRQRIKWKTTFWWKADLERDNGIFQKGQEEDDIPRR